MTTKFIILIATVLCYVSYVSCKQNCFVYIRSQDNPKLYWYEYHLSLPVLSEISKTAWEIESPTIQHYSESLGIRVHKASETNASNQYLCIKEGQVRLCAKKYGEEWLRSFKFAERNGTEFRLKTMKHLIEDTLYVDHKAFTEEHYNFNLVEEELSVSDGVVWEAEVIEGCHEIFNLPTPIFTLITTTTPVTTNTTTSETSILESKENLTTTRSETTEPMTTTTEYHVTTIPETTTETPPITTTTYVTTIPETTTEAPPITSTTQSTIQRTSTQATTVVKTTKKCIKSKSDKNVSHCFNESNISGVITQVIQEEVNILMEKIHQKEGNVTKDTETRSKEVSAEVMNFTVSVEQFGLEVVNQLEVNDVVKVESDDIKMKLSNQKLPFVFEAGDSNSIIVEGGLNSATQKVIGILYQDVHTQIEYVLLDNNLNDERYELLSKVINAAVIDQSVIGKVYITLDHLNGASSSDTKCAFWNDTGNGGYWSTNGCTKLNTSTHNRTECECSHLTNFAILTSHTSYKISETHQQILNTMSFVCSIISISFLFIGIFLFMLLLSGERKHTRYIIHLNLMVALFIAQLVFIAGVNANENRATCQTIAYLLHYFFLASFTWMLVEGLYLYFAIIKVFSDGKIYLRWYMIFAWGMPAVVVIITGSVGHKWYGAGEYCWLSGDGYAIWAFLVPVLCIILINSVILFMIISQIVHLAKSTGVVDDIKTGLRSSLILLPILGITWLFGVISFNSDTLLFQYLFNISNSLQGFMITLFHCFLNSEVRNSLHRKTIIWTHSSSIGKHFSSLTKSRFSKYDTSFSTTSHRSATPVNNRLFLSNNNSASQEFLSPETILPMSNHSLSKLGSKKNKVLSSFA